jgi:hypothetical protein
MYYAGLRLPQQKYLLGASPICNDRTVARNNHSIAQQITLPLARNASAGRPPKAHGKDRRTADTQKT